MLRIDVAKDCCCLLLLLLQRLPLLRIAVVKDWPGFVEFFSQIVKQSSVDSPTVIFYGCNKSYLIRCMSSGYILNLPGVLDLNWVRNEAFGIQSFRQLTAKV